jgi:hypothetical protein
VWLAFLGGFCRGITTHSCCSFNFSAMRGIHRLSLSRNSVILGAAYHQPRKRAIG